uniref:CYRIA/CYRIB Rac1 binding domain-containing protein n=1 Tax=Daphnia galeata TaxID=27404 RepID=A0A8J2WM90_9CRUS|nr:unnamed protein product [Daphnia galeata]
MGNLLRLLAREEGTCFSPQRYDLFLDFENAQPTDGEKEMFLEVEAVLKKGQIILSEISQYRGASKEIREAISNPGEDYQEKARDAVFPLVQQLRRYYDFSLDIEKVVPKILSQLCSGSMSPTQHLEKQQALVKQFAEILEFVLKFDEHKMTTPSIQNDFSYYRRIVSRHSLSGSISDEQDLFKTTESDEQISSALASHMSLFYAQPTPMLKVLSEATMKFVADNKDIPVENTTETLSTMASVCQSMLKDPDLIARFMREETYLFVLRVMVGLVILYDHVHPVGAFQKSSNVDVKGCVRVLKEQPSSRSESLLNALRYTTRHLNDESTPKHIKTLLAS